MLLNPLTFHTPTTLSELNVLLKDLEHYRLQAGGTFLLNALKLLKRNGARTPDHVITLQKIDELRGIMLESDALRIGSMTTIAEIFDDAVATEHFPVLKQVCRNISTQPIRNMATIGGNLTCRYTWTEMPAVCIGLKAMLHFTDHNGKSLSMSAEEFFKNEAKTDNILTHVTLPLNPQRRTSYRRVKKSQYVDIPMLSLLISGEISGGTISDACVSINNCVEFAQRDTTLEEFLNTNQLNDKSVDTITEHLTDAIYDKRGSDYKRHMFEVSLKSAVQELLAGG